MELDEFKIFWSNIQQKEIEKQKLTAETLDTIIMKITNTLTEIQQRNAFWSKLGAGACGALIVVLLANLAMAYFIPHHSQIFGKSIMSVIIMVIFALTTVWFHKWLERIFIVNTNKSLKEVLTKMLADFKRFYLLYNIVYLFLFPAYYYAFIKLFLNRWILSPDTILLVCGGLTIISLMINHWYYKIKYFKKIKILKEDLNELS
ncbi:MAG: hypothetical protein JWP37_67 [Mucilaginibacter sp.]|nr:hypothetical protein [Mucilaginibacter sp.]